ncbi:MAG: PRD domain-containing protein [Treponema sp.]|nr:PRD domain-containing protein [Treponema sp.]
MPKTVRGFETSPRLHRLFELLLRNHEPMKVDDLAAALETSRRTVFRELENAAALLTPLGGAVSSVPGKGIIFSGGNDEREKLKYALSERCFQPASKRERLLRLLMELIANTGAVQKLYYYAASLSVSESTVSKDIDELEPWLAAHNITITRKSGLGITCTGSEESLRAALVSRFMTDGDSGGKSYTAAFGYPGDKIERGVRMALRAAGERIDWMTVESYAMMTFYLLVMTERFMRGNLVTSNIVLSDGFLSDGFPLSLAVYLLKEIEKQLSCSFPETEQRLLMKWIGACRAKQDSPLVIGNLERQELAEGLALRMVDRFDPPIAAILKTNDELVRLLSQHLIPSLTRLKEGIELPNPLEEDLIKNYPDVYQKTCRAAKVLEEYLGSPVPSNEISFLEIHFLAALAALGEQNMRRRVLRAGIVCAAGIGTSYMLAHQIRKRFKGELQVEIASWDDRSSWAEDDFLISTISIEDTEVPCIRVQTILGEEDFKKIQDVVIAYGFIERNSEKSISSPTLEKTLGDIDEVIRHIRALLRDFSVESIKGDCSFEELADFAAHRFAPENPLAVYHAFMNREAQGTQVVHDLEIVLLHARTAVKTTPVFAVIVPEGGVFTKGYFKNAKSCVFMLLPEMAPKDLGNIMGGISSAIIDMAFFLEALQTGNREGIRSTLEIELSGSLALYCNEKLKK